jgi:hypothetical protein
MRNAVFWDIKTSSYLTGNTLPLCYITQSVCYVRSEVSTAATLRMPSSGMLRREALVRTNVSEDRITSIIRATRIGELGRTLAVTSNRSML